MTTKFVMKDKVNTIKNNSNNTVIELSSFKHGLSAFKSKFPGVKWPKV